VHTQLVHKSPKCKHMPEPVPYIQPKPMSNIQCLLT
jgi:hypothetical protein